MSVNLINRKPLGLSQTFRGLKIRNLNWIEWWV